MTREMKAELYFLPAIVLLMMYKMVANFDNVDENLHVKYMYDH